MNESSDLFDVIFIDLPDPKSVDLARLYALEFYQGVRKHLTRGGVMITQATSPFFSRQAFLCILKTMEETGLPTLPLQVHIPTMGQWGWVLAVNEPGIEPSHLKQVLMQQDYHLLETQFLNRDAGIAMLQFGKDALIGFDEIEVNSFRSLKLVSYYQKGAWDFY